MIDESSVSLWIGHATSLRALERCLDVAYSEDGEFRGSAFSRAFAIKYYDEDFREAEVLDDEATTFAAALAGCSSEEKVIAEFEKLMGPKLSEPCNAFVLLYNFRYEGAVPEWTNGKVSLRFFGVVNYR